MADDLPLSQAASAALEMTPPPSRQQVVRDIPFDLMQPGAFQARRQFTPSALRDLADSIRENGIVQPVVVRPLEGRYEILAGERRWRAAQMAGLEFIPCVVRTDLTDRQALTLGLIENIQRASFTPIEEAEGLRRLRIEEGMSPDEIAEAIGKSRPYISNSLRLLTLPQNVQHLIHEGQLSAGHGKMLVGLEETKLQALVEKCVTQSWTVRKLEAALRDEKRPAMADRPPGEADTQRLVSEIADRMGCRVDLQDNDGRGVISLHYNSLDELDGLLDNLLQRRAEMKKKIGS